jgi:hypothetical protein
MLAMMLLSAALPSFACLANEHHSACCQQMTQDCSSSMTMADSCCKMRSTDTSMPPALATQPHGLTSQIVVAAILMPAPVNAVAPIPSSETPPGAPASDRSSILRI